jgi:hypothetical protein
MINSDRCSDQLWSSVLVLFSCFWGVRRGLFKVHKDAATGLPVITSERL